MGKSKPYVFQNQLKTLASIEDRINNLIAQHRDMKDKSQDVMFRTTIEPHSPTVYHTESLGKKRVIFGDEQSQGGLKEGDYLLSESNPDWVLPSKTHGLSFSSTFNQTKFTLDLLGRFQKKGTKISVAYWILEDSTSIPKGLGFEVDPNNSEHFFLVVTEKMLVSQLIEKLNLISQRMAIMNDLDLEAYKK
ncbi:hypothetical protein [Microbulbifer sp. SSSA005]|uniref:hypothetical protein n=1 Tax=unclassified Microbulbifer TaxID=2619833 RepID=UPI004039A6A4